MTTATAGTKHCKKMYFYFTFERRNCVDPFSTPVDLVKLAETKRIPTAFKPKKRDVKLAIAVRVLQNT